MLLRSAGSEMRSCTPGSTQHILQHQPTYSSLVSLLPFPLPLIPAFPALLNYPNKLNSMSGGGNVEGYLLKVEGDEARIVYCIMDEGIFQYYSQKGGELVGAVPLTGCKVEVVLLPNERGHVMNQFRVDATMRPVRKRGSGPQSKAQQLATASQKLKVIATFAASSPAVMDKWAVSILNWNRYSWDDPETLCSTKDEHAALTNLVNQCTTKMVLKESSTGSSSYVPPGVSRAVQPL